MRYQFLARSISLIGTLLLVGCQAGGRDGGSAASPPGTPAAVAAAPGSIPVHGVSSHTIGRPAADAAMTFKVKAVLLGSEGIDGTKLDVDATGDGSVKLEGSVPTEEQKRLAEQEALKIDGVREVINALKVEQARIKEEAARRTEDVKKAVNEAETGP